MQNRLKNISRNMVGAMVLLSACGLTYSCSDDYDLPDSAPQWLGSSIYEWLQHPTDGRSYSNYVNLIKDLDYAEVLSKTGSKTLFVASDSAFNVFFANNPWGVKEYSDLSLAQKKLLLYSGMIDNPYLLEMLPNSSGSGDEASGSSIVKGNCMRHETSVSVTDSIPYFAMNSPELPVSYNATDVDYWKRFREEKGIHLAEDGTAPMMVHFLASQMAENKITDEDFRIITGQERNPNDAYIFGSKIIHQDQTCQNGYVNVLDRVLVTPANMAEVLRTNGNTNIFSHMVDRFSVPVYNKTLTYNYNIVNPDNQTDSVFEKRYFYHTDKDHAYEKDPYGNDKSSTTLLFDPGWNQFNSLKKDKIVDMASIFAPNDEVMKDYFLHGGGYFLLENYAKGLEINEANLLKCIDCIPMTVVNALINNLMKISFIESVPSKFETVTNDAQDVMGLTPEVIDTVLLANNGAVYLLNKVFSPAQYSAVSAPAYVSDNMRIFNWAIQDGKSQDKLNHLNYYAYLLAMSSRFSLFIPSDDVFTMVYNASSTNHSTYAEGYVITWDEKNKQPKMMAYQYEPSSNSVNTTGSGREVKVGTDEFTAVMRDLLETHTVVHDASEHSTGMEQKKEWYLAKNGAPIHAINITSRDNGGAVCGGWQNDRSEKVKVIRFFDQTENGNGMTYIIDQPLQTTTKSTKNEIDFLSDKEAVSFASLCEVADGVLGRAGIMATGEKLTQDNNGEWDIKPATKDGKNMRNRYLVYEESNGLTPNVKFFNSYNYTVFVPNNEAIADAIERGLPTWESIESFIDESENTYNEMEANNSSEKELDEYRKGYQTKAQAMITALVNFVKYHFVDRSYFADKYNYSAEAETNVIDDSTRVYYKIKIDGMADGRIQVRSIDNNGSTFGQVAETTERVNLLARDYQFNTLSTNAACKFMKTSSFAVVHELDKVLDYKTYANNRYDSDWSSVAAAKAYLAKYRIQ